MNPLESPVFTERLAFLQASEFWSTGQHAEHQRRRLQHLVHHVELHVPFYRDHMRRVGFSYKNIRTLDDLSRFPLLDKSTIQNRYDDFVADYVTKEKLNHRTTGGSTGTPLTVYSDDDFFARDKANTEYYMRVLGLDIFSYRSVRLYGDKIDQSLIDKGRYWHEVDARRLVMSCYHITHDTVPAYLAAIDAFGPRYFHTRPSSVLPLASAMAELGLALDTKLDAIFCDGEYLTVGQRQIIEQAFSTKLINIFGHTEGATVGIGCRHSNALHFMPQVGIVEVLAPDGTPLTKPGSKGELVVTGFNNPVFPFIRYRTGDVVVRDEPGCACGRNYTMISDVEGRIQDYIVDSSGNLAPLAPAIFNYNDMDWKGIREFKMVQEREGELKMLLQPEPGADGVALCAYAKTHLEAILGGGFSIEVNLIHELTKTRIGKYRYLDQKLDLSSYFRINPGEQGTP